MASALALLVGASTALAQETVPAAAPTAQDAAPGAIKWSAFVEAGFTGALTGRPASGINYGQPYTDKANQALLNQVVLTVQRDLDPKADGFDWGFKIQPLYGADARYLHFLGEADLAIAERNQFDVLEANALLHLPVLTPGGVDLKIGQYATPLGVEVNAATGNALYSHSYTAVFSLPFKHTGVLATAHVSPILDLYGGVDTGVNTSLTRAGDNNSSAGGIFGFGLTLDGGALSVLALTHVGPENPSGKRPLGLADADANSRWINDIVTVYKPVDDLTLTFEVNYTRDDAVHAEGYGATQYVSYALSPTLTLNTRAEIWRDANGFFVAGFRGNEDYVRLENGLPTQQPLLTTGRGTTYSEVTVGVAWKPEGLGAFDGFTLRPEVRYDHTFDGVRAYYDLRHVNQVTFGIDAILPFSW